jgi:predicted transposase/invertase (TIGR01784 family)
LAKKKASPENMNTDILDNGAEETPRFDHDGLWKDFIKGFFYLLLKRTLPELYEASDREKEPTPLDKEFRDVLNTSDPTIHTSPHFADYVMKVPLKDGGEEWVLLHIEVQGRQGGNLAERINHYRCLIYAHYRREPVALAIVTDRRPPGEPSYYSHSRFGTEIIYRYSNLVLSELDDDELIASDNPADIVLYAAKFALRTKEELQKFNFLRKAVELLGERGWSLNDKRDLLLFIERIVNMKDEGLIRQYKEFLEQHSKEGKTMYIPLILRDSAAEIKQQGVDEGIEKGMEKGIEKGKLEVARNLLANGVSADVIAKSADLPLEKIRALMN